MPDIRCPHCNGTPSVALHRFLPGFHFAREEFVCSLCSLTSLFAGKSQAWSVAAGAAGMVVLLLALRGAMGWAGVNHIRGVGAAVFLLAVVAMYQVPAALMLRRKAALIPVGADGG